MIRLRPNSALFGMVTNLLLHIDGLRDADFSFFLGQENEKCPHTEGELDNSRNKTGNQESNDIEYSISHIYFHGLLVRFVYMFWWSTTYLAMLPGVTSFSACSSGI